MGRLYDENQGLIHEVIKRHFPLVIPGLEYEDYLQWGRMGLSKAERTYDENRGKFATWAWWKIRGELSVGLSCMAITAHGRLRRMMMRTNVVPWRLANSVGNENPWPRHVTVMAVREAINTLDDRQRRIVEGRMADQTFKQIGSELGMSAGRAQQIHAEAKSRLKRVLS